MRTPVLVGIVVAVHCVAIGSVMLVHQGCAVRPLPPAGEGDVLVMPPDTIVETPIVPETPVAGRLPVMPEETTTYVVANGDTLSGIASAHGLNVSEIVALNKLSNKNIIRVGQKLLLPGRLILKPAQKRTREPARVEGKMPAGNVYTVKQGDSLSVIAKDMGVSAQDIREANGLSGDRILIGQKLIIPGKVQAAKTETRPIVPEVPAVKEEKPEPRIEKKPAPVVAEKPAPVTAEKPAVNTAAVTEKTPAKASHFVKHVVQPNETIDSIAMLWGVSGDTIKKTNKLADDKLSPGLELKIPLGE